MTEKNENLSFHKIQYQNSGDSPYGDHHKVVGYNAIAITMDHKKTSKNSFSLTIEEKKTLLNIARKTITDYLKNDTLSKTDTNQITSTLKMPCGAFVSLHKNNNLRGCIGSFSQNEPLYEVIKKMALASALNDTRFSPVKSEELMKLKLKYRY